MMLLSPDLTGLTLALVVTGSGDDTRGREEGPGIDRDRRSNIGIDSAPPSRVLENSSRMFPSESLKVPSGSGTEGMGNETFE